MGKSEYVRGRRARSGQMSEDRASFCKVMFANLDIYIKKWTDEEKEMGLPEYGPNIVLMLSNNRGQRLTFDVTSLTMDELKALKNFFEVVWELAEPIVRRRDEVAQDEFSKGNDRITRVYRAVPQLVIRNRIINAHRESLLNGFAHVPPGHATSGDSPDIPGVGGAALAEQVQEGQDSGSEVSSAKDDGEASDQP